MKEPMELGVEESLELLAGEVFGRLAFTTPGGPRIVPLNYTLHDGAIVFRTTHDSEIATYAVGQAAAFEVDGVDHRRQTGWSVVALGPVVEMTAHELQNLRTLWVPRPWAGGLRNLYLQLTWRELSGRRLREELATTVPTHHVQ